MTISAAALRELHRIHRQMADLRGRLARGASASTALVVEATELVPTLHQAYDRIDLELASFGWFLCGPSKTADIEQSLVLGAHGPCTMSLVVTHD